LSFHIAPPFQQYSFRHRKYKLELFVGLGRTKQAKRAAAAKSFGLGKAKFERTVSKNVCKEGM
jgi:hypothetical protein